MKVDDCVFCKIVAGDIPAYVVWQDEKHIAFLNRHPNTEGFTVVITKDHYGSYFAELPNDVRAGLVDAAASVAKLLDSAFEDVGRTGLIFEGFGVDHIHAKLVPMHGTEGDQWQQRASKTDTYYETYQGYIASNDSKLQEDEVIAEVAKKITG